MNQQNKNPLTEGAIYKPLIKFMLPVMLAVFLQAMYSAVDLIVIGHLLPDNEVQLATSAVGTGSMIMVLLTYVITGLSMGAIVVLGRYIGAGDKESAGKTVGATICIFAVFAIALTVIMEIFAPVFAKAMNAPSVSLTVLYIRICSAGIIAITAYNVVSGLFRGIGNSKLPLIFVLIACVANIVLDLVTVGVFHMGVAGVAFSTIFAQFISVVFSIVAIQKMKLPFAFGKGYVKLWKGITGEIMKSGIPLALQDFLTNLSFVVINAVANGLGADPTKWAAIAAGYSVDNKITAFLMIVPSAFLQSMAVFTAQNYGAEKKDRIGKALKYMVATTLATGIVLACLTIFGGKGLASIFTGDGEAIEYAAMYLKGFSLDCLFGSLLLMMLGFFNGMGLSNFVMIQGLVGAFLIRIPVVLAIGNMGNANLTMLGVGCASATCGALILCVVYYFVKVRRELRQ
ncbi:MAG: MATE family efflux transporter [Ruminococcus sp.]|nr:MATE family efflux transporter [Ruminococcus sp.]